MCQCNVLVLKDTCRSKKKYYIYIYFIGCLFVFCFSYLDWAQITEYKEINSFRKAFGPRNPPWEECHSTVLAAHRQKELLWHRRHHVSNWLAVDSTIRLTFGYPVMPLIQWRLWHSRFKIHTERKCHKSCFIEILSANELAGNKKIAHISHSNLLCIPTLSKSLGSSILFPLIPSPPHKKKKLISSEKSTTAGNYVEIIII